MADATGELIELVELDQDICKFTYSQGPCFARLSPPVTNLLLDTDHLAGDAWEINGSVITDAKEIAGGFLLDKLISRPASGGSGTHHAVQSYSVTSGTTYTLTCVVCRSQIDLCRLVFNGGYADYDLSGTGSVDDDQTDTNNATITDLGDGCFRLKISHTATSSGSANAILYLGVDQFGAVDITFTGNGNDGLFAGNFQLETGGSFTSYEAVGPTADATGEHKCYNTRNTCQAEIVFAKADNPLTLTLSKPRQTIPLDRYVLPSLKSISTTPSRLNTTSTRNNTPLGQRAVMTAMLQDHADSGRGVDPYADERISGAAQADGIGYDPLRRGTFWAKWRARNLYYLGRPVRSLQGVLAGTDFDSLTTRNYIIERVEGPSASGVVKIVAKDPLKLADDERAQAPLPSIGELAADINDTDITATLAPAGIGDDKYETGGKLKIGSEVVNFSRGGDTLTINRAQNNTQADDHEAGDSVQQCLVYIAKSAPFIVNDLLTKYAGIDPAFIPLANWDAEAATFLPRLYSAVVTKPTAVKKLIGELEEQAGFSIWWDEVAQLIRFSVVKQPSEGAQIIDDNWIIENSFKVKDKPESRLSQVWTAFGQIDPIESLDDENNYRITLVTDDAEASGENQYNQESVYKIFSRWIPATGKADAQDLNERLLSRFRDIIREFTFDVPAYRGSFLKMGDSHTLRYFMVQDIHGETESVDVRILAIDPMGDRLRVTAEELRFVQPPNAGVNRIIIATDTNSVNLRELHDARFLPPTGTEPVELVIEPSVVVGSDDTQTPSVDVGDWPAGQPITVTNLGEIIGAGGAGGTGNGTENDGAAGGSGLYTRVDITVDNQGLIAGGGGGGGGLYFFTGFSVSVNGGGGGAGVVAGAGGQGTTNGNPEAFRTGADGTKTTGGGGGSGVGGAGGDLGQAGQDGDDSQGGQAGTGGAAGSAVDGETFITYTTTGTITGNRIN